MLIYVYKTLLLLKIIFYDLFATCYTDLKYNFYPV